ncbi:MAG: amino acid permease [Alphaproteobacteria bacterium]|nr:amino acid permease [Alphaproteobacteria bacterium]
MTRNAAAPVARPLGFWACWALTVGTMIGSGIFTLPALLAPYGLVSFSGWIVAGIGSILVALTLGRLAARTTLSGGPYVFAREAFGDFPAFLTAWGHWASYWIATPAIAIAFVGYLPVFVPSLADYKLAQALIALALIWAVTLVNMRGLREAGAAQLAMTLLKIAPLLVIIVLAMVAGAPANLPAAHPAGGSVVAVLATCVLLTTWAFSGMEAGCMAASDVKDPERTIPRALIIGVLTTTVIYIAVTAAVMLLVPAATLTKSTAPFAEAARGLGAWGPMLVSAGALVATAGALNGTVFTAGQIPAAVARDGLAPEIFARTTKGGGPHVALIVSGVLSSLLLAANYTRGAVEAFTFLLMMSTLATLAPLIVSVAAEAIRSRKVSGLWTAVALVAGAYCAFAALGSGLEVMGWGLVLLAAGVPFYYVGRVKRAPASLAAETP